MLYIQQGSAFFEPVLTLEISLAMVLAKIYSAIQESSELRVGFIIRLPLVTNERVLAQSALNCFIIVLGYLLETVELKIKLLQFKSFSIAFRPTGNFLSVQLFLFLPPWTTFQKSSCLEVILFSHARLRYIWVSKPFCHIRTQLKIWLYSKLSCKLII